MKALHELTTTERARLLADLFPEEIPSILNAISQSAEEIMANKTAYYDNFKNPLFTAHFWIQIAEASHAVVARYKNPKLMNSRVFSDQLFYGHMALFSVSCILTLAETRTDNPQFKLAIELLFNL